MLYIIKKFLIQIIDSIVNYLLYQKWKTKNMILLNKCKLLYF